MAAMLYHTVTIEETGESYRCSPNETVLAGMERLGRKGIPVGCRGGGCGVCKIQVTEGSFNKRVMSREFVSEEDEREGRVLACCIRPASDIKLRVIGLLRKNLCAPRVQAPALPRA